ncbi:MAG: right-handed parallel beta-helix repeat-containing protein [Ignavibacteria bacterium]|nr:right-handed parallel beta-helix repeat-containing protein [Ignavibacteria bacterium]
MKYYVLLCFVIVLTSSKAQELVPYYYAIGTPTLTELYVDPIRGDDNNSGTTNKAPFRSFDAAWRSIPSKSILSKGFRINLSSGFYTCDLLPNYMEERYGTFEYPIIIQGDNSVFQCGLNIYDCRYLYIVDLSIIDTNATADVLHFDHCDHVLLKNSTLQASLQNTQECLKINQTQYCFIEGNDISGAWDNAFDAVAVQYGHVVKNKIHDCGDWAMYLKGGSAYFRVEGNEFYNAGVGGFTAGQGTGFQFMTTPWIHYEAYDVKFVNNIIHDCHGAAMGVHGGYNILMAFNTSYKIGSRSHLFEVGFGERSCDGDDVPGTNHDSCSIFISRGGWGNTLTADGVNFTRIPNKNVYVMNNIFYNPPTHPKGDQFLTIFGAFSGIEQNGSNVPVPTLADNNLIFKNNIFWNGGDTIFPLGIEGTENGCGPNNPLCNETQLRRDNYFNTILPELQNPDLLNFYPLKNGNLYSLQAIQIPAFTGTDRENTPATPAGRYDNAIFQDFDLFNRSTHNIIGALSNDKKTVGINEILLVPNTFTSITPNPASDYLNITYSSYIQGRGTIELLTLLGDVVSTYNFEWRDSDRHTIQLSLQSFLQGTYFCKISTTHDTTILPFTVYR